MRHALLALFSAVFFVLPFIPPVLAEDDVYYVELGNEATEEDAIQTWQALSEKHKEILGKLQFYPKAVLQKGKGVRTRIQAGALSNKKEARDLCRKLFKLDTPCFVVEGMAKPSNVKTSLEEREAFPDAQSLPWEKEAEPVLPEPKEVVLSSPDRNSPPVPAETKTSQEEKEGFMPWLFGGEEKQESSTTAPSSAEGKVEVAEAIRVPLSDEDQPKPVVVPAAPSPKVEPFSYTTPQRTEGSSSLNESTPGWLNVTSFVDEEAASSTWEQVREQAPAQAAGLRVRIVHPATSRFRKSVSLNVGPFANREEAMSFCQVGVLPVNESLHCGFSQEESTITARLVAPRYQHGRDYAARRMRTHSQRLMATANTRMFWLQVASAPTQIEALKTWETLKNAHDDLLGNLRSSVSAPVARGARFVVRVGPIEDHDKALNICGNLQDRGVSCRVYSNM